MSSLPITSVFNDGYIAEMYESFQRDPASVDESWRQYFRMAGSVAGTVAASGSGDPASLRKAAGAASLLGAIQRFGHLAVQLDPLGTPPPGAAELKPEFHGITDADLHALPATALKADAKGTAADVIQDIRSRYCGSMAFEVEHLSDEAEREWFRAAIETGDATAPLTSQEQKALLQRLTEVDGLERFLGLAYSTVKRFSIEGVDALVPMFDEAITRSGQAGAKRVVIGMAHRGRLNTLTHVMGKPYFKLLEEFEGRHAAPAFDADTGDVKYHMGYRGEREIPNVGKVSLELVPNPSHLEVATRSYKESFARISAFAAARRMRATRPACCPSSFTATRRFPAKESFRKQ
jgi:2-oxoglutarate dehydrogenase E1 component